MCFLEFLFAKNVLIVRGCENKLKAKKMRTDESFPMVQTILKNDQSLRGKSWK